MCCVVMCDLRVDFRQGCEYFWQCHAVAGIVVTQCDWIGFASK